MNNKYTDSKNKSITNSSFRHIRDAFVSYDGYFRTLNEGQKEYEEAKITRNVTFLLLLQQGCSKIVTENGDIAIELDGDVYTITLDDIDDYLDYVKNNYTQKEYLAKKDEIDEVLSVDYYPQNARTEHIYDEDKEKELVNRIIEKINDNKANEKMLANHNQFNAIGLMNNGMNYGNNGMMNMGMPYQNYPNMYNNMNMNMNMNMGMGINMNPINSINPMSSMNNGFNNMNPNMNPNMNSNMNNITNGMNVGNNAGNMNNINNINNMNNNMNNNTSNNANDNININNNNINNSINNNINNADNNSANNGDINSNDVTKNQEYIKEQEKVYPRPNNKDLGITHFSNEDSYNIYKKNNKDDNKTNNDDNYKYSKEEIRDGKEDVDTDYIDSAEDLKEPLRSEEVVLNSNIISLMGIENVSCIDTGIMLAVYLVDKGYNVAYFELNKKGYIKDMVEYYAKNNLDNPINVNDIDFYYNMSYSYFEKEFKDNYNFVIIDCGIYDYRNVIADKEAQAKNFFRGNAKIMLTEDYPWNESKVEKFIKESEFAKKNNNIIYINTNVDKEKGIVLKDLKKILPKKTKTINLPRNTKETFEISDEIWEIFSDLFNIEEKKKKGFIKRIFG